MGHRPTSGFCAKNMGILRHLFELLRGPDAFMRDLLTSWATGVLLGDTLDARDEGLAACR